MTVEIRELIIRAVIKDEAQQTHVETNAQEPQDQSAIIEACVKQVLKILKRKQER